MAIFKGFNINNGLDWYLVPTHQTLCSHHDGLHAWCTDFVYCRCWCGERQACKVKSQKEKSYFVDSPSQNISQKPFNQWRFIRFIRFYQGFEKLSKNIKILNCYWEFICFVFVEDPKFTAHPKITDKAYNSNIFESIYFWTMLLLHEIKPRQGCTEFKDLKYVCVCQLPFCTTVVPAPRRACRVGACPSPACSTLPMYTSFTSSSGIPADQTFPPQATLYSIIRIIIIQLREQTSGNTCPIILSVKIIRC